MFPALFQQTVSFVDIYIVKKRRFTMLLALSFYHLDKYTVIKFFDSIYFYFKFISYGDTIHVKK